MNTNQTKVCVNCQRDFTIESEDFAFYEKIKVPPPTWCPECRLRRKLSHRNERSLYKRKCDLCQENIISIYSPKSPYIVYCPKCWHSDKWDAQSFGRDYDFSRTFFEQFKEFDLSVPHIGLIQENTVNSPWVNCETDDKNCYLNFGGHLNEDCAYNQYALKSRDSFDNFWMMHGEFTYSNILCENGYSLFESIFCFECQDTWFSFDCRNCSNVIGCSGLRHKKYHIFNKPVSKEEYEKFVKENLNGSRKKFVSLKRQAKDLWRGSPQRALFIDRSVNCTGNLIKDCKNCRNAWNTENSEDSAYTLFALEAKNSMDITSIWKSELCYETCGGMYASSTAFSLFMWSEAVNIYYSLFTFGASNCFGCSNLRHSEYSILNKKYSKEDYFKMVEKIKKHMDDMPYVDKKGRVYKYGEFFPYELSPFSYDETVAGEYFPLDEKGKIKEGVNDFDHVIETNYDVAVVSPPDSIKDVGGEILYQAIKCQKTGKLFKIIPMELQFYRRFNLPIPTENPTSRHHGRLKFISDHLRLVDRICYKCKQTTKSVYTEEEFPMVYCDKCYHEEMY